MDDTAQGILGLVRLINTSWPPYDGFHSQCLHEVCFSAEGDCDGLQGYFASLCLGNDRSSGNGGGAGGGGSGSDAGEVTALHLTVTKFHPPPADRHATILHPLKRPHPAHMSGAFASGAAPLWAASGTGAAEPALLPLAFSLRPSAQHLSWEPHNRSVVERYLRHRETPRSLCRHVPCG